MPARVALDARVAATWACCAGSLSWDTSVVLVIAVKDYALTIIARGSTVFSIRIPCERPECSGRYHGAIDGLA